MRVLLLANPAAGRRARSLFPPLREFLRRRCALDYHESASADDLRERARAAAVAGFDRVLAAGGDGTAHAALNALAGAETALGLLPLGNGNDLARALGVPRDPLAAADFLLRAPVSAIDVAAAGDELFGCVGGAGFDAETNRRANRWGAWAGGHARYLLAGLVTLASYRPIRLELVSDTEDFSGEAMWAAVANSPVYGGGIRIAPEARLDDGVLDVCVIEPLGRLELLELYPRLLQGTHLRHPRVRYFRATQVEFRGPAGTPFQADGEFIAPLPLTIQVRPAALRVVRASGTAS